MNILKHTKPLEAEFDALRREIRSNQINFEKSISKLSQENQEAQRSFHNSVNAQEAINSSLTTQIEDILATPDAPPPTNYYVPSDGAYYFGDGTTEGDWRIIRQGDWLVVQRLESSVWVNKYEINN